MTYLEESQAAGRHIFPDLTRAFALIGIALVNVATIAYPMMKGYHGGGLETGLDTGAYFTVNALFTLKSYTLFSFMFGVGFAYQIASAERAGASFNARYWRRIIGLLVLGLLHVALLFQGDILVMYALLGSVLFLFRNKSGKSLMRWGIGIYLTQILLVGLLAASFAMGEVYAPEDMAEQARLTAEMAAVAAETFRANAFVPTISQRFADWSQVITFGMLMQGIGALAFFVFGLAAVKFGAIADPSAPFWKRCRRIFLPIGLIGSAAGAYTFTKSHSSVDVHMMLGMFLITLASPFSTAGYLGLIAKWAEKPPTPLKIFLARGGTASLTAYLMQGVLLSLIFNGYGLGYFGELGAATCIAIALGVALFTISFASLWRTRFQRGPMEALLRGWTYLGKR